MVGWLDGWIFGWFYGWLDGGINIRIYVLTTPKERKACEIFKSMKFYKRFCNESLVC